MTVLIPLVSILVITYNQENLILETVESCLRQTYENLEIVVSDDGSTDRTPEILREVKRRNPEMVRLVLNQQNGGITANSNAGLAACSGEYIALMGGDDLLLPTKIASQVDAFQADPDLVLSYHPCHVMRNGELTELVGNRPKDIVEDLVDMIGNFGAQMPGPATMVRANAIHADGFNVEIGTASDWMFFIDVSSHGEVRRIDETLAIYRQHGGNVGERYFSYSDDFIKTLELADRRYGDLPRVAGAVRKGGRRFLLGITYRAMELNERTLARSYAKQLSRYAPPGFASAVLMLTWIPGVSAVFAALKSWLKRYV